MAIYALGHQVPEIHPDAVVHPDAVIIGSVVVGAGATVAASAVLRGDDGFVYVGDGSRIEARAVLHTTFYVPTTVGANCVVGEDAHLEGCTLADGAVVERGAVVLHEAQLGAGSVIAADAMVPNRKLVPAGASAAGVPVTIAES